MTATSSLGNTFRPVMLNAAEYEALPDDPRLELVDGVLHVMPPATGRHQSIVDRLLCALERVCPDDLRVVWEQEIRIADDHRRNPDLMLISATAYEPDNCRFPPAAVTLAVEVTGPGTETADRLHKPAEYASVGVPHYWRIVAKPEFTVFTYRLGEAAGYRQTGQFGPGDTLAVPGLSWAKIKVDDFTA
jgi:Uma2 family endonuclease